MVDTTNADIKAVQELSPQGMTLLAKLGGRKYTMGMTAVVGCLFLCGIGKLEGGLLITAIIVVVGEYITGNVWQKANTPPPTP